MLIPKLKHTATNHFFLIAGPCVVEGEQMCVDIAAQLVEITNKLQIPFMFKGSYKKANRSRLDSFTGIGDEKALEILRKVGKQFDIPVVTDIHTAEEAMLAAKYVDVLQIPAFLCRQTDLLIAAAKTQKIVNIKKGQFVSPQSMQFAVQKVTSFGYQDLIVDYRSIPEMRKLGVPVVLDATHSLQQPNQAAGVTAGQPELIETITLAGMAAGIDGLFIETHQNPSEAKSDGSNMLKLSLMEDLLQKALKIRKARLSF
jgi:2-dehydro-3-deoxyphosphooctonate aldolase (KDO 8-P synthase)